jgi:8-oxo-dGTP diphosphatase
MSLYLVRHAKAGSRSDWPGDDRERPLSRAGQQQADGITLLLGHLPISRIYSSPYLRCVQTVEPLAKKLGLELKITEALAEGDIFDEAVELVDKAPKNAVLCSHGDVIPAVIDALLHRGLVIKGEPDWRKGATWVLDRKKGDWAKARAVPPPAG